MEENFKKTTIITGDWGDPKPQSLYNWEGDYIVSFLSPWILPQEILDKAKKATINFHPAPPKYPGIGCYNFALYNDEKRYGVMCHHMLRKVDSGIIIGVKYFPLYGNETILSLKEKAMVHLTELFYEVMDIILSGKELPKSSENWEQDAYTRKEFQELCHISLNMGEDELKRRLRATYFPGALDYPNIKIGEKYYILVESQEFEELRKK